MAAAVREPCLRGHVIIMAVASHGCWGTAIDRQRTSTHRGRTSVTFAAPGMLWLLVLGPLLVGAYVLLLRRRQRSVVHFPDLHLIRQAQGRGPRWRRHVPALLLLCSLMAIVVGLGRPSANLPLASMRQTIVLAVDVSLSMDARDVNPSRLTAAQAAARAFVEECPADVRIGLIAFGGSAFEVQPPTDNRGDLVAAIDRFSLQRGTATGSALYAALASLLPEAGQELQARNLGGGPGLDRRTARLEPPGKAKAKTPATGVPGTYTSGAIILMSDGKSTMGPNPIDAAMVAASHGVRVSTIGFGTKEGATVEVQGMSIFVQLDEETLRAIADITRGTYFHAGTAEDLAKAYRDLTARLIVERKDVEITFAFVALAMAFLLVAMGLSLRWFPPRDDIVRGTGGESGGGAETGPRARVRA